MKASQVKAEILDFLVPTHRYTAAEIGIAVFGKVTKEGKTMDCWGATFAISRFLNELVRCGDIGRWKHRSESGCNTFRYGYPDKDLFDWRG